MLIIKLRKLRRELEEEIQSLYNSLEGTYSIHGVNTIRALIGEKEKMLDKLNKLG